MSFWRDIGVIDLTNGVADDAGKKFGVLIDEGIGYTRTPKCISAAGEPFLGSPGILGLSRPVSSFHRTPLVSPMTISTGTFRAIVFVTPKFWIDLPLGEKEVLFSRSASNFNKLAQLVGQ